MVQQVDDSVVPLAGFPPDDPAAVQIQDQVLAELIDLAPAGASGLIIRRRIGQAQEPNLVEMTAQPETDIGIDAAQKLCGAKRPARNHCLHDWRDDGRQSVPHTVQIEDARIAFDGKRVALGRWHL